MAADERLRDETRISRSEVPSAALLGAVRAPTRSSQRAMSVAFRCAVLPWMSFRLKVTV
jgi:hypothetical protein